MDKTLTGTKVTILSTRITGTIVKVDLTTYAGPMAIIERDAGGTAILKAGEFHVHGKPFACACAACVEMRKSVGRLAPRAA